MGLRESSTLTRVVGNAIILFCEEDGGTCDFLGLSFPGPAMHKICLI